MSAYYNENNPYCAEWLRDLISEGHIAPGDVDERSIEDVKPDDLRAYTQCHFVAGIGVWSYALRQAGWPDDEPVWTGSCPCQPFSAAGKRAGFADERHLWPSWFHLIEVVRPPVVFGEQVEKKNGLAWLDLVQADLEGVGYACGPIVAPSAGFGAPHIRSRLYFVGVADTSSARCKPQPDINTTGLQRKTIQQTKKRIRSCNPSAISISVANANDKRSQGRRQRGNSADQCAFRENSLVCGMADTESTRRGVQHSENHRSSDAQINTSSDAGGRDSDRCGSNFEAARPGSVNGYWRNSDWLYCRDDKWRPVEPGTFPLVNGTSSRVGRLRAYGNAINAEHAKCFIEAFIETRRHELI